MKQFLLTLTLCISFQALLFSQNIIGNWEGAIDIQGNQLPILFHFYKDSTGAVDGRWDSPKQKASNLTFSQIDTEGDSLHLAIKMINGYYNGKFIGNDSIAGIWRQGNNQLPLNFLRTINAATEKVSSAYPNEKEIAIATSPGVNIFGTLLSKNHGQKLAVIIAGSGPTDRNGNSASGMETNSYKMLSRSLDSQNIATFRYDKRGVAKSASVKIKEDDLRFDDYVNDLEKIFDYLHDTLKFKDIYFIGHSEGSLIAMISAQKRKVKGFISLAGAGRPIDAILKEQMQKQPLPDSIKQQIPLILGQLKNGKQVDDVPQLLSPLFRKSVQPYMISWMKYSPVKEIKKITCPILILQGSCDIQVKIEDANSLHNANKNSILEIIPSMSHTLKNAGADCIDERKTYTDGLMPVDTKLINEIVRFVEK